VEEKTFGYYGNYAEGATAPKRPWLEQALASADK